VSRTFRRPSNRVEIRAAEAHFERMKHKGDLAPPEPRRWTRADDYLGAMARRRTARRQREAPGRTQPESPRLLLSTIPFLALIAALAILAVGIMIVAWPGSQPQPQQRQVAREQGVAPKGWFQEAEKDFQKRG
jgi:anti-sigma factor RsiW